MSTDRLMQVIQGDIQALRVVGGRLNLIEDLQKGMLFTGAAAAIASEPGMLANPGGLT